MSETGTKYMIADLGGAYKVSYYILLLLSHLFVLTELKTKYKSNIIIFNIFNKIKSTKKINEKNKKT